MNRFDGNALSMEKMLGAASILLGCLLLPSCVSINLETSPQNQDNLEQAAVADNDPDNGDASNGVTDNDGGPGSEDGDASGTASGLENEAGGELEQQTSQDIHGTYYQHQLLTDTQLGVAVFDAFLPQGWNADIASNWNVLSVGAPGLEEITLMSPDGLATVTIDSCQAFTEHYQQSEGQDFETYTTYMNYKTAPQFVDYFMDGAYAGQYTMTKEFPDDEDVLGQLRQYNDTLVAISNRVGAEVTQGGTIGNISSTDEPYDATMSRRQYDISDGSVIETICVDAALRQNISGPIMNVSYIHWRIPYSIVYRAVSKEAFEAHYQEYETIIANSSFTPQYYQAEDYVSQSITAAAMDAKAAASAASSYSSSGYDNPDTDSVNDRVMEMWDDCIKEVDSYNTLDGGTVKTSMYNDIVAQDGDSFFVGSSTSDIPSGYTELSKQY